MTKVPLVSIFKITNFVKGEYKKWYYTKGELEEEVWEPLIIEYSIASNKRRV